MTDSKLNQILTEVFTFNGLDYDLNLIRSKTRKMEVVVMRKTACMALKYAGLSYHQVANFLHLDHCTVIHHVLHSKWARGYDIVIPNMNPKAVQLQIDIYQKKIDVLKERLKFMREVGVTY